MELNEDEANDLLSNGILVQTSKGLVCMSLNDALSSDLNLSVEELRNVASQLLLQTDNTTGPIRKSATGIASNSKSKPLISVQSVQAINSSFVSSDGLCDSDGFTSESSDIINVPPLSQPEPPIRILDVLYPPSQSTTPSNVTVLSNIDGESFLSSNVSDSDASTTAIVKIAKPEEKTSLNNALQAVMVETTKLLPAKKRGGWPKGRKRKPELLHLPPKAPSTGYNLYLNEQRKLYKDGPLPFHEITKLVGNKWSSLGLEEKKPYLERAEEEKRRYREELREYRQSGAYQLYLANKRRKRAKYNVMSESDMDATDDLDEEDNEELYCRTCDQYFHNLHNKREHLQGRQHMESVAGAIRNELGSDYDTDCVGNTSIVSFSTSLDESSMDGTPSKSDGSDVISEQMVQLVSLIAKRDNEVKTLQRAVKDKKSKNIVLHQQLTQLKERELKLKKDLATLKETERAAEAEVFNLWQVPSWFVISDISEIDGGNVEENA